MVILFFQLILLWFFEAKSWPQHLTAHSNCSVALALALTRTCVMVPTPSKFSPKLIEIGTLYIDQCICLITFLQVFTFDTQKLAQKINARHL